MICKTTMMVKKKQPRTQTTLDVVVVGLGPTPPTHHVTPHDLSVCRYVCRDITNHQLVRIHYGYPSHWSSHHSLSQHE